MTSKQERDAIYRKRYRERHIERVRAQNATYYQSNKDKISQYNAGYYEKNGDDSRSERLESSNRYYRDNRERLLEYHHANPNNAKYRKRYRDNNPHKVSADSCKRRAQRINATPAWADVAAMETLYKKRDELNKLWGVEFEVDHIVPLRSKRVCGLHCEANLQLIERSLNRRKSNSWWCDQ